MEAQKESEIRVGASRVELLIGGQVATFVDYSVSADARGEVWSLLHVETAPSFARRGLATELVAGTLAQLRASGLRMRPLCPFVAAYVRDHPEDEDLVA